MAHKNINHVAPQSAWDALAAAREHDWGRHAYLDYPEIRGLVLTSAPDAHGHFDTDLHRCRANLDDLFSFNWTRGR